MIGIQELYAMCYAPNAPIFYPSLSFLYPPRPLSSLPFPPFLLLNFDNVRLAIVKVDAFPIPFILQAPCCPFL